MLHRRPADHAHGGPDVDGAGQAIAALGNEDDAFVAVLLGLVDRGLDRGAVVGLAVAHGAGQVHGTRIVEPRGVDGSSTLREGATLGPNGVILPAAKAPPRAASTKAADSSVVLIEPFDARGEATRANG